MNFTERVRTRVIALAVAGLGLSTLAACSGDDYPEMAKIVCQDWIKEELKRPDSAEFSNGRVEGEKDDFMWFVYFDVRAENTLGDMAKSKWTCMVEKDGDELVGKAKQI